MQLFTRKKILENKLPIFKKSRLLSPNSTSERSNFKQMAASVIIKILMPPFYCPIKISLKRKILLFVLSLLAAVLRFALAGRKCESKAIVIEPFGMGDAISLLPMVNVLCESFDSVDIITKKQWAPIFQEIPKATVFGVNLPWSSYSKAEKYRFANWLNRDLRSHVCNLRTIAKGAIGYDPRGDIRSILILYLIGCSKVYTLDHYLGTDAKIPKWAAQTRKIDQNQQRWRIACKLAGDARFKKSCAVPPPIRAGKYERGPVRKIAFLPVAPWRGKLWTSKKWHELIALFDAQGFATQGLCGPGQKEQVQEMLGLEQINECTTIEEWFKSLLEIDLLITLDSGPMHLADALGTPLIVLFGSSPLPLWAPSGKLSRVLHHQNSPDFHPVHQIEGNEKYGEALMDKITVDEVWDCFQNLVRDLKATRQTNFD
jgi:ADP-heptose:LPS heptosyltransferase